MNFKLRDEEMASRIIRSIASYDMDVRLMHVCGTHQDTLVKFGLEQMLKDVGVEIRQGPGCPVCVTTGKEIAEAMTLAEAGKTVCAFGDMMNVPTSRGTLMDMRSQGHDVRIVYSIEDAVAIAKEGREVVFMSVGFETTTPSAAITLQRRRPENFTILSCHRLLPPALDALFKMGEIKIDGFIQPGHVAVIIGMEPFRPFSEIYHLPQVIAGFEPLDLLMAVQMLVKQLAEGRAEVENEYSRLVRPNGNPTARAAIEQVFMPVDRAWRGFPVLPGSALELRPEFVEFNARAVHEDILATIGEVEDDARGCRCGDVLRGLIESAECPLFGKACTPKSPRGPCMVSREGNCNISYRYGGKL